MPKTQSKFGKPIKVVGKKGLYTYKLSDGRCWNASHLAPALAPGRLDESDELPLFDSGDTNPVGVNSQQQLHDLFGVGVYLHGLRIM